MGSTRVTMSIKARSALALAVCSFAALVVAAPASAGTLDQQQPEAEAEDPLRFSGQTFTAGLSGALDQVDLWLRDQGDPMCDSYAVTVEIRTASDGLPTNTVLASNTVASSELSETGSFVSVLFEDPADILAGTQYAIVVTGPEEGGFECAEVGVAAGDPYAGGTQVVANTSTGPWGQIPHQDLAFKTYVILAGVPSTSNCQGRAATLVGTPGDDSITGTNGDDSIVGLGGDDVIGAAGGEDCLSGDGGRDVLRGGAGHDLALGGDGKDKLRGQNGRDKLKGGEGKDKVNGGNGKDKLKGNAGNDKLKGAGAKDKMKAGGGDDKLGAQDGKRDRVNCGGGDDRAVVDPIDRVKNCETVKVVDPD
jgi:Ca2+-binding RTX toxin-like protein